MDPPSTSQEVTELVRELLREAGIVSNNHQIVVQQSMAVHVKVTRLYEALERGVFDK